MEKFTEYIKQYWDTLLLVVILGMIGYFGLSLVLPVLTEAPVTTQIQSETQTKMQTITDSIKE